MAIRAPRRATYKYSGENQKSKFIVHISGLHTRTPCLTKLLSGFVIGDPCICTATPMGEHCSGKRSAWLNPNGVTAQLRVKASPQDRTSLRAG